MSSAEPVIIVEDISKTFHVPDGEPVHTLRHVTNHVDKGECWSSSARPDPGKARFYGR